MSKETPEQKKTREHYEEKRKEAIDKGPIDHSKLDDEMMKWYSWYWCQIAHVCSAVGGFENFRYYLTECAETDFKLVSKMKQIIDRFMTKSNGLSFYVRGPKEIHPKNERLKDKIWNLYDFQCETEEFMREQKELSNYKAELVPTLKGHHGISVELSGLTLAQAKKIHELVSSMDGIKIHKFSSKPENTDA